MALVNLPAIHGCSFFPHNNRESCRIRIRETAVELVIPKFTVVQRCLDVEVHIHYEEFLLAGSQRQIPSLHQPTENLSETIKNSWFHVWFFFILKEMS